VFTIIIVTLHSHTALRCVPYCISHISLLSYIYSLYTTTITTKALSISLGKAALNCSLSSLPMPYPSSYSPTSTGGLFSNAETRQRATNLLAPTLSIVHSTHSHSPHSAGCMSFWRCIPSLLYVMGSYPVSDFIPR
jgi:hypothetical protein